MSSSLQVAKRGHSEHKSSLFEEHVDFREELNLKNVLLISKLEGPCILLEIV